jgi:two-component system invasion response regulator UvrY
MTQPVRILLVDDHSLLRQGLIKVLTEEFPLATISGVGDSLEAKRTLAARPYDLAILDVDLPGQGGIDLLEYIHSSYPGTRVIVISGYPEELFAVRALRAGAFGCLSKGDPECTQLLCQAVTTVLSGSKFITHVTSQLLASELDHDSSRPAHQILSNREYDILVRLGSGCTPGNIARELNISVKTVSTYRTRILTKLQMKNNANLIEYAIRNDLVPKTRHSAP